MENLPPYLSPSNGFLLTLLVLSPLVGMLLVALLGALNVPDRAVKYLSTAWSANSIGLAVYIWSIFDPSAVAEGQAKIQLVEWIPWFNAIRVEYFMGVDGI